MTTREPSHDASLVYRSTANARLLPLGLFAIFLGLVLVVLAELTPAPLPALIPAGLCLVIGGVVTVRALLERFKAGKPLYTLSPDGVTLRIPSVKEVLIPWREVRSVETQTMIVDYWWPMWLVANHTVTSRKLMVHPDVTLLGVSKDFYDKHLHVTSLFRRGPSWKANFVDTGDDVLVALHHSLVATDAAALRQAVETRWQAARQSGPGSATHAPAAPVVVAASSGPYRLDAPWETCKIAASVIGIAAVASNLLGIWQFPGQADDRLKAGAERTAARTARQERADAAKRRAEELKARDAEQRALQRDTEETLRRAFGR